MFNSNLYDRLCIGCLFVRGMNTKRQQQPFQFFFIIWFERIFTRVSNMIYWQLARMPQQHNYFDEFNGTIHHILCTVHYLLMYSGSNRNFSFLFLGAMQSRIQSRSHINISKSTIYCIPCVSTFIPFFYGCCFHFCFELLVLFFTFLHNNFLLVHSYKWNEHLCCAK